MFGLLEALFMRFIFQRLPEKRRKIISHHDKRSRLYNFTLVFYEEKARPRFIILLATIIYLLIRNYILSEKLQFEGKIEESISRKERE